MELGDAWERRCQRCHDEAAVWSLDVVPGAPPAGEAGELCSECVRAVVGSGRLGAGGLAGLRRMAADDRLGEIERTRRRLGAELDDLRRATVRELRRRGWSWGRIGAAGGVTRARAHQIGRG